MKNNILWKRYTSWLMTLVKARVMGVMNVCIVLQSREFTWFVPNDDNRLEDGRNLRDRFVRERGVIFESEEQEVWFETGFVSVLEVIVGICSRIEEEVLYDLLAKERLKDRFWELLSNLHLTRKKFLDGDQPLTKSAKYDIDHILTVFLERTYGPDGTGGLFPLRKPDPNRNMARIELWDQMNAYLDENKAYQRL